MSNPGGLSEIYLSKGLLGGVFYIDVFFILSFIFIFIGQNNIKALFNNRKVLIILLLLFIFSLYKIFVWGLIVPDVSKEFFVRYCLIRERDAIYGFLFIIPVYLFAMKNLSTFLYILIIFDLIILLLTILTIVFSLDIIQVNQLTRYRGSEIIRYYFNNYGLLSFVIPASIIVFAGKIQIKYKWILFLGGILAVILIIVSLTKGLYLALIGTIIATVYLTIKLLKIHVAKGFRRVITFGIILFVSLIIIFPKYTDYSLKAFSDIFLLATKGETSEGDVSRYWQIPALVHEINENPLFGTGQGYEQLSSDYDINQYDATDLPLLAHIMQYGFIGIFIYLLYYFKVFQLIKLLYKSIKSLPRAEIINLYKYEIIFVIGSIAYFIGFLMRTFQVFIELTRGSDRIEMSIYTGLLLACLERIRRKILLNKATSDIDTIK